MKRWAACSVTSVALGLPGCNSSSRQMLEQAEARWREGNYDDAIRLNTLLYKRDREGKFGPQALLNIGNIYYLNLRQLKDAVENYKPAGRGVSRVPAGVQSAPAAGRNLRERDRRPQPGHLRVRPAS